jgi:transposase InsO family protein
VIVAYIDDYRERFGIEPICAVLTEHDVPIAPNTYHAHKKTPIPESDLEDAYLVNAVVTLWRTNNELYGIRKMWHAMRRSGYTIGRDQVGRLMRIAGVQGVRRGDHRTVTTTRGQGAPRHPDLVKRGWNKPTKPDMWWVADFTYVWTLTGFVYVSFITDVYSRRILGWRVMSTKETELVASAVEQSLATRRRYNSRFTTTGLVHHSDAGSQYTSIAFTEALNEAGIAGSIGTVGDALDNALMESTIGLYKTELINHRSDRKMWENKTTVETVTAEWVHWYNNTRLHSSIGYMPPIEKEMEYVSVIASRREVA